jgi:hypothetical protein
MQAAADPDAFDSEEMRNLCIDMLGSYLWGHPANGKPEAAAACLCPPPSAENHRPKSNGARHKPLAKKGRQR